MNTLKRPRKTKVNHLYIRLIKRFNMWHIDYRYYIFKLETKCCRTNLDMFVFIIRLVFVMAISLTNVTLFYGY